jgi:hypothetical protein
MLDERYRVIGIARVYEPGGNHAWFWTTDFGGAIDPSSHGPWGDCRTSIRDPGTAATDNDRETVQG